jgi:hypothetical protein
MTTPNIIITVTRNKSNKYETLSTIQVDGIKVCDGLEDEYREVKVKGDTRIAAGIYPLKCREFGGFHEKYAKRFPAFHEGMIEVGNVPNFSDILIHCGNTEHDTMGCLLVGTGLETAGRFALVSSAVAYERFYKKVIRRIKLGGCFIQYIDRDR